MGNIDLHLHSTASDGKYSPSELVLKLKKADIKAAALTDHDTIKGVNEFVNANKDNVDVPIELIPGVEIEVGEKERNFTTVHVLGLFIDSTNSSLNELLDNSSEQRTKQKKEIILKLNELGYEISFEDVRAIAKGVVGRPHIAKVLVERYPKEFRSLSDVFVKLLSPNNPAFIERSKMVSFNDSISAIHASGGLAFLAHPFYYPTPFDIINYFISCGGDGVETIYPYDKNESVADAEKKGNAKLLQIIKNNNLLRSGGSDFHGTKSWEPKLGELFVPLNFLDVMKQKYKNSKTVNY
jgi:3',5'-nucleoside bisphosphate phosphatase